MNEDNDFILEPMLSDRRVMKRTSNGTFRYVMNESLNEYGFTDEPTTKASTLFMDVPAGKRFHLRFIAECTNAGSYPKYIKLREGSAAGTLKYAGGFYEYYVNPKGIYFDDDIYLEMSSMLSGQTITLGGILDPLADQ